MSASGSGRTDRANPDAGRVVAAGREGGVQPGEDRRPSGESPWRRRRYLILVICSTSLFLTYLNSTVVNMALPAIQSDLHTGLTGLQWVVDTYLLVLASLFLLAGSVADRLGRRRVFTAGLVAFSVGSLACGWAPTLPALIGFRVLQALGGAMLTPVSLAIVREIFTDPRERAQALGIWSGVFGLATACGPVIGGLLVDTLGWRSVFWINIPVGAAAVALTRRHVPESRARRPRRMDPLGQALIMIFLAGLTYTIVQGPVDRWSSVRVVMAILLTLVALTGFVLVEHNHAEPLLDLQFFASRPFSGAIAIATVGFAALAGFLFVNTLFLETVRHASALSAGLATLPATGLIAASAPLAGRILARIGPRPPLVLAGLLLAAGSATLLGARAATSDGQLATAYALLGLAFGLVNPPITYTAISGMPPDQAGVASAVAATARQTGSVLGVAVMGALLTTRLDARPPGQPAPQRPPQIHDSVMPINPTFTSATHGPWLICLTCGVAIAVIALATTGPRAQAKARSRVWTAPTLLET